MTIVTSDFAKLRIEGNTLNLRTQACRKSITYNNSSLFDDHSSLPPNMPQPEGITTPIMLPVILASNVIT